MKQDRSLLTLLQVHWLSWTLMVMAYATYGGFLHHHKAPSVTWALSSLLAICSAWVITLGWPQVRRIILLGFQSDMGYFVMALSAASLAVVAVTWFQLFAYFAMLVAVSLLARVDNLIAGFRDAVAFFLAFRASAAGASAELVAIVAEQSAALAKAAWMPTPSNALATPEVVLSPEKIPRLGYLLPKIVNLSQHNGQLNGVTHDQLLRTPVAMNHAFLESIQKSDGRYLNDTELRPLAQFVASFDTRFRIYSRLKHDGETLVSTH